MVVDTESTLIDGWCIVSTGFSRWHDAIITAVSSRKGIRCFFIVAKVNKKGREIIPAQNYI